MRDASSFSRNHQQMWSSGDFSPIAPFFSVLSAGERHRLARDLPALAHKHSVLGNHNFYAPAEYLEVVAPRH